MSDLARKRRCTAVRMDGAPCRAWAVRQRAPQTAGAPRCAAHRHTPVLDPIVVEMPRVGGIYDHMYSDAEFAALRGVGERRGLEEEVGLVRVLLRRMFEELTAAPGMGGRDMEARVLVILKAVKEVGDTLLKERELLDGEEDPGRHVIAMALEELSEELFGPSGPADAWG